MACTSMKAEDAMKEYITEVKLLIANTQESNLPPASEREAPVPNNLHSAGASLTPSPATPGFNSQRSSAVAATPHPVFIGNITKEGQLFKKRDYVKGWRPRYFILEDTILNYFLDKDDEMAKGSLFLNGCEVILGTPVTTDEFVDFFPFTITHAASRQTYTLSCASRADADDWVAKLDEAVVRADEVVRTTKVTPKLNRRRSAATIATMPTISATNEIIPDHQMPVNPVLTYQNLDEKMKRGVDKAVATIVDMLDPVKIGEWEVMFEKKNVKAYKKAGDLLTVRGDSILEFSIKDIFTLLSRADRSHEINPQISQSKVLKILSQNSNFHYLEFKKVWPTAPRDFCNLNHWRIMADNRVVIVAFSNHNEVLAPQRDGVVRGDLVIGGYILTPTPAGTLVQYLIQYDLKGTIPQSVQNFVSQTQPLIVSNIRKVMTKDKESSGAGSRDMTIPDQYTFQDLWHIREQINNMLSSDISSTSTAASNDSAVATSLDSGRLSDKKSSIYRRTKSMRITPQWLLLLLTPVVSYFYFKESRAVSFLLTMLMVLRILFYVHYGEPIQRGSTLQMSSMTGGKLIFRFPIDLTKLLQYLNSQREESGLEVTLTHVIAKVAAMNIYESKTLNGHIILGNFYRCKTPGVDISVSVDTTDKDTLMVKIVDADVKPLDYIAQELQTKSKELRQGSKIDDESSPHKERVLAMLPNGLSYRIKKFLMFLGGSLGLSIPVLGVSPFPLGVCAIIASPYREGDSDLDVSMIPNTDETSAPITISVGGVRIVPSMDADRRMGGAPSINLAVTVNTKACSLVEAKRFCSKLQQSLNNPFMLDGKKVEDNKKKKRII